MYNGNNYPSCIKVPPANSKQNTTPTAPEKFDIKEALAFNNELILLANRIFGEGKWSHTVTNQTIDFAESFMGKYVCGCATFIKIQLQDGTFHEDMGYCHAEGAMKGLAIHCARIGSLTDAFKRTFMCFNNELRQEIQKLSKKISSSNEPVKQKEDLHCSLSNIPPEILEPCAQSTPLTNRRIDEQNKPDHIPRPKSPNEVQASISVPQTTTRPKSPVEQKEQSAVVKASSETKNNTSSKSTNHQKEQSNQKEQESKKALSDEELLRLERKRKQMEKQAEYKRLMKEREQQKTTEIRKPNPKY